MVLPHGREQWLRRIIRNICLDMRM